MDLRLKGQSIASPAAGVDHPAVFQSLSQDSQAPKADRIPPMLPANQASNPIRGELEKSTELELGEQLGKSLAG